MPFKTFREVLQHEPAYSISLYLISNTHHGNVKLHDLKTHYDSILHIHCQIFILHEYNIYSIIIDAYMLILKQKDLQ